VDTVSMHQALITELPLVDALFDQYAERFGRDQTAYRNHVYRLVNLVALQQPLTEDTLEKLQVAAFFHDAGIWLAGTFNYLSPSARLACHYLHENGRGAWSTEVQDMILDHHKLSACEPGKTALVEAFRRADWIDLSRGLLRFTVPRPALRAVLRRFPNAGFHRRLLTLFLRQMATEPWRPLPMLRR
jgi:hypothetical protein